MLTGERLLEGSGLSRAMPTSTQHLTITMSSICHSILRWQGRWHLQQLSPDLFYGGSSVRGGSWGEQVAHNSAENTEPPEKKIIKKKISLFN